MPLAVILVFQADKRFFVGFVFLSLDLVSFYAFNGFRNFAATRQVKIAALAARKVHVFIFRLQGRTSLLFKVPICVFFLLAALIPAFFFLWLLLSVTGIFGPHVL